MDLRDICQRCYHDERQQLAEWAQERGDYAACAEHLEQIWHDCDVDDCFHECELGED